jgi:hypothetical protein
MGCLFGGLFLSLLLYFMAIGEGEGSRWWVNVYCKQKA